MAERPAEFFRRLEGRTERPASAAGGGRNLIADEQTASTERIQVGSDGAERVGLVRNRTSQNRLSHDAASLVRWSTVTPKRKCAPACWTGGGQTRRANLRSPIWSAARWARGQARVGGGGRRVGRLCC